MNFKKIFAKTIGLGSQYCSPIFLQKLTQQRLIAPIYHTCSDVPLPHIAHLYRVKTVTEFEKDIDFLLKYFEPLDFFEFRKRVESNNYKQKPAFLLTFDDGLRDFHDIIAPILLKKGVPAINFLNSAFIDNQNLMFRYKVSVLISFLIKNNLKKPFETNFLLEKKHHDTFFIDEMAKAVACDFDEFLQQQQPYLTTPQIKDLQQQGFQFGAHSHTHPEYRFLSLEQQLVETQQSVNDVQIRFNLNYRIFAFPFTDVGVSKQFFQTIKEEQIADFTFGSAGQKHEQFANHFQRIPFESGLASGLEIHNTELLYYALKAIFNKNEIKR